MVCDKGLVLIDKQAHAWIKLLRVDHLILWHNELTRREFLYKNSMVFTFAMHKIYINQINIKQRGYKYCNYIMTITRLSCYQIFLSYRCQKWVQNTRRQDLLGKYPENLYTSYRLCSRHFEDSQFMNAATRNALVWNATPTLFNIPNPPPTVTPSRKRPSRAV